MCCHPIQESASMKITDCLLGLYHRFSGIEGIGCMCDLNLHRGSRVRRLHTRGIVSAVLTDVSILRLAHIECL